MVNHLSCPTSTANYPIILGTQILSPGSAPCCRALIKIAPYPELQRWNVMGSFSN